MNHRTPEVIHSGLTPAQSADVIRYFDASENKDYYENNWREPKVKLGRVALHTTQSRHSLLSSGEPMLTIKEATEGFEYLLKEREKTAAPKQEQGWPIEPTDEQLQQIEELVDKIPCSYTDAYERVMGIRIQ
jgi:hypothetical protein